MAPPDAESLPVSIRLSIGIHVHRACHTSQFSRPRAGTGLVGQTPRIITTETALSPRPASRSKVGGHLREGDRSSC